jgi:hypothetical protein
MSIKKLNKFKGWQRKQFFITERFFYSQKTKLTCVNQNELRCEERLLSKNIYKPCKNFVLYKSVEHTFGFIFWILSLKQFF